jgi:hypothetical protein
LEDSPRDSQASLLVPDLDVALNEEEKEFMVTPEFVHLKRRPAVPGHDDCLREIERIVGFRR